MKISKRIEKIIEYIDIEDKVADIGCDHGYLCLGCLKKGVSFVQNIDNKIGPLSTAKSNLQEYMDKNIIFTLCDGLDKLDDGVDTVVISGMGGDLITQIVNANLDKTKKLKKLIIVAHSKVSFLRENLTKYFGIFDEDLVEDNGKIYEIIIFTPQRKKTYSEEELLFGPILINEKSELFIRKITKRLGEIDKILDSSNVELINLQKEKKIIEEIIKN